MVRGIAGGFGSMGGGGGGGSKYDFNSPTWTNARTEANSFFSGAMS
jgi:hypothetical protein